MALVKAASLSDILNGPRPKMFAIQHYGHKTGGEKISGDTIELDYEKEPQ